MNWGFQSPLPEKKQQKHLKRVVSNRNLRTSRGLSFRCELLVDRSVSSQKGVFGLDVHRSGSRWRNSPWTIVRLYFSGP